MAGIRRSFTDASCSCRTILSRSSSLSSSPAPTRTASFSRFRRNWHEQPHGDDPSPSDGMSHTMVSSTSKAQASSSSAGVSPRRQLSGSHLAA